MIGIADRGIELGEVVALVFDDRCYLRYPCAEESSVHVRSLRSWTMRVGFYRPQRRPGVSTGASHRSVSVSVSRHTVTENPCISRLVM